MLSLGHISCVVIISFVIYCNGKPNEPTHKPVKNVAVKKIIEKIYNLTSQTLVKADNDERDEMMKNIEKKLIMSAEPLGAKADKYVKLIMHGLQAMANNAQQMKRQTDFSGSLSNLRRTNNSRNVGTFYKKGNAAQDLANNILKLADEYINKEEKPSEDKVQVMENIRHKVLGMAKQKHDLIHIRHNDIKKYTDLISRGMELMIKKLADPNQRRMVVEFVQGTPANVDDEYENQHMRFQKHNIIYKDHVEHSYVPTTPIPNYREGLTTPLSCDAIIPKTCADVKSLNLFPCTDNGVTIPLVKLCNGVLDCGDGSDEGNCVNRAMDRLQAATGLITRIEHILLRNCFLFDDSILLIKQNSVLNEVLHRQIGFLDKYKNMNRETLEHTNAFTFKRTLNEVIVVINTLASALDSSLCARYMNEKQLEQESRKFYLLDADDLDELPEKPVIRDSLKSCTCSGSFCANLTCPEACSRVCWHKHSLDRWVCQAVNEGTSVPLDAICDGTVDCYDGSDESDCKSGVSLAKFEANDIYNSVLKLINKKISMKEYSAVKNKLIALGDSIRHVQKVATNSKLNIDVVKSVRNICFASIVSIYEDLVSKAHVISDLEDAHMFLLTLSERLMTALKLSHTGNDKIFNLHGCYCRKDKCAATTCTPSCRRACTVDSKLTRYWCKGTNMNISIPVNQICNGKPNCPFEDDESQCSFDVCRKHHLMLLRNSLRNVGAKQKGTAVGESLRLWKTKVISTIQVAENTYRPTPITLRELVTDVLHDLVTAYAALDDTRRANNDYVIKEFHDISQVTIEGLKGCGK